MARQPDNWWKVQDIADASDFLTHDDVSSYIGDLIHDGLVERQAEPKPPRNLSTARFQITEKGRRQRRHKKDDDDDSPHTLRPVYT
jgi:hypothetical protein